jgi:hypothetical protein
MPLYQNIGDYVQIKDYLHHAILSLASSNGNYPALHHSRFYFLLSS